MKRGKLIVLEGGDGSGKATQLELLERKLAQRSLVTIFDFPRYEQSLFGSLVGRSLAGEFGDFLKLNPYWSSLPFTLDRIGAKEEIQTALTKGHVLCNRYTPSNVAHQSVKLPVDKRQAFIDFLEKGEYDELGLPRPDIVMYLAVNPDVSSRLILEKGNRGYMNNQTARDQYEQDTEYLRQVAAQYRQLAAERPNWRIIECMDGETLLSPAVIHEKIMAILEQSLSS